MDEEHQAALELSKDDLLAMLGRGQTAHLATPERTGIMVTSGQGVYVRGCQFVPAQSP